MRHLRIPSRLRDNENRRNISSGEGRSAGCRNQSPRLTTFRFPLFSPIAIQFLDPPNSVRRQLRHKRRPPTRENCLNASPIFNQNRRPHLRILIVLRKEKHAAFVFADGPHAKRVFQNAPVRSDRNPGSLTAGRQPHVIGLVEFEMFIVNPNRESFFPQCFRQLLASQVSVEKEDIDFRLLGRTGLPLQFETPSTRSPPRYFRFPLRC